MSNTLAAITGASAGIGAVFAERLAAQGRDLLLIARRRERLEELGAQLSARHSIRSESLAADLASPEGVSAVEARLAAESRLAMLVNNAGFGTKGRFFEAPLDEQVRMHRLHVEATLRLTRAALPGMVARGEGAVINVSSVAGFARSPGNVSYCATKAWMNAFTEGLSLELRRAGSAVKVQALCPGFTYSEFHDVLGFDRSRIPKALWTRAEDVVDASLRGLRRGRLFVVPGWRYRLFVGAFTKIPAALRLALEGWSPHRRDA